MLRRSIKLSMLVEVNGEGNAMREHKKCLCVRVFDWGGQCYEGA